MTQTSFVQAQAAIAAPPRGAQAQQTPAEETQDPLLRFAGAPQRALIAGEHTVGLLCALLHRGCPAAATIRPREKPDAAGCDLLLLPDAAVFASPDEIVRLARRVLAPNGRVIARLPSAAAVPALARRLRLNGFAVAAVQGRMLRAERRREGGSAVA